MEPVGELGQCLVLGQSSGRGHHTALALHAACLFTGFHYSHTFRTSGQNRSGTYENNDVLRLGLHRLPRHQIPRLCRFGR
jgi:hypothetical protein